MKTQYITIGNTKFVYELEGEPIKGLLKYRHETLEFHGEDGMIYTLPDLNKIFLIDELVKEVV